MRCPVSMRSAIVVSLLVAACGSNDGARRVSGEDDAGTGGKGGAGGSSAGGKSGGSSSGGVSTGGAPSGGSGGAPEGDGGATGGTGNVSTEAGAPDASSDGGGPPDASVDSGTCTDGASCSLGQGSGVCCDGQCVAGDCCSDLQCGDAGGTGFLCSNHACVNVAASLSGLLWKLPCNSDSGGTTCNTNANTTVSTTLGGGAGLTYDVALHFRGVVEQKTYLKGCSGSPTWIAGGAPANDTYNVYRLTVSSPPQTFYLNTGTSQIERSWVVDFHETIRVDAGATLSLYADAIDGSEIKNIDATSAPLSVAGVSLTQPYNGQFIQMDVDSVTPDPVAHSQAIGGGSAGHALSIAGAQYATIADAASVRPASLTAEAWFDFAGATAPYHSILGKTNGGGTQDSYTAWIENGSLNSGAGAVDPSGAVSTPWTSTNAWHHFALTYDAAAKQQTMYIDGGKVSCVPYAGPVPYDTHPFLIGADIDNGSYNGFWNGTLDEVRLFSVARTPAQIWADMHTHALGATAGLVGEWTFDEGTGQTTADKSGTGNVAIFGQTNSAESTDPTWVTSTVPF